MKFAITDIIGRFHPVLVHLPVGILLLAVLFYLISHKKKYESLRPAVKYSLLAGTIAAALSCISGFFLSQSGEYDASLVSKHQWLGIGLTVTSAVAFFMFDKKTIHLRWMFPLISLLVIVTGHLGGTLTHGEGYLFTSSSSGSGNNIKPIADVQQAVVYTDIIKPILQTRCYNCHGRTKQKGELRLDEPSFILQGGETGKTIVPGNITESELIKRISLPSGNEDHMPPKSKPQLTKPQIQLLNWWVSNGADFHKRVNELKQPDELKSSLALLQTGSVQSANNTADGFIPEKEIAPAADSVIRQLTALDVSVQRVARNSNYLSVSFVTADSITGKHLRLLQSLDKHIIWLKTGGAKLNDAVFETIGRLSKITRLSLNNTTVSDERFAYLTGLKQLQYLNLSFTPVTGKRFGSLAGLKNIKQLFLYKTNISADQFAELKKNLPAAMLDTGGYKPEFLASDTMLVKPKPVTK